MAKILVTGVNRGIGAALFAEAAAAGHDPIGTTRDGRDGTVALTLDDPDAIPEQLKGLPPFDILINNAGIYGPTWPDADEMDYAHFAQTLAINTMAPLAVSQALLPQLRQSLAPRILTISSQMSFMGYRKPSMLAYRASKAAVNKVMQGLATILEPEGIPVALIDPGWVKTDMGGPLAEEEPEEVARGILALALRLTPSDTGRFFRFTGEERAF
jgi:NAD(P)-dependent dehydrogenase (short-subunit alcohol dehydrogenase family)